jgi:hypothetical protein
MALWVEADRKQGAVSVYELRFSTNRIQHDLLQNFGIHTLLLLARLPTLRGV